MKKPNMEKFDEVIEKFEKCDDCEICKLMGKGEHSYGDLTQAFAKQNAKQKFKE